MCFIWRDHLERLQFSMAVIEMDEAPSTGELTAQVIELLRANGFREDCYVRVQTYIDDWGDMTATGPVGSSVVCRLRPRVEAFETGKHFARQQLTAQCRRRFAAPDQGDRELSQ